MVRLRIRRVTAWNIGATVVVGLMFFVISFWGNREFHVLQDATEGISSASVRLKICRMAPII